MIRMLFSEPKIQAKFGHDFWLSSQSQAMHEFQPVQYDVLRVPGLEYRRYRSLPGRLETPSFQPVTNAPLDFIGLIHRDGLSILQNTSSKSHYTQNDIDDPEQLERPAGFGTVVRS